MGTAPDFNLILCIRRPPPMIMKIPVCHAGPAAYLAAIRLSVMDDLPYRALFRSGSTLRNREVACSATR